MINGELFAGAKRAKIRRVNSGEANYAFQCKQFKLPTPVQQFQFAKPLGRKFAADFAFVDFQLLIEINGGIWLPGGGAHSRPANIDRDIEKQQYAALLGYMILPFTPSQVKTGFAINFTNRVLHKLGWRP